ncbi:MAG: hypothetical protein JST22_03060 [Bacteroidetes bacterium]|nr:hypothetical protein [Bacteroidota bacterium]
MSTPNTKPTAFFVDQKRVSDRAWTATDAKAVPFVVAAAYHGLNDSAFGFTTEAKLNEWAGKEGLAVELMKGHAIFDRAQKNLTDVQEKALAPMQASAVEKYTTDFFKVLADAKIGRDDANGFIRLLSEYDPFKGPISHSVGLFGDPRWSGRCCYMPGGWGFPDFTWMNFNNQCSSAACIMGGIHLWDGRFFTGRRVTFFGYPGIVIPFLGDYPYFFDDAASSAITW